MGGVFGFMTMLNIFCESLLGNLVSMSKLSFMDSDKMLPYAPGFEMEAMCASIIIAASFKCVLDDRDSVGGRL